MSHIDYAPMRAAMVSNQLRTNAVTDVAVLDALGRVAREAFVPAERAGLAYVDVPVPLDGGRSLNAPLVTARLVQELGDVAGRKVLIVGGATGYSAALLVALGAQVIVVESDSALSATLQSQVPQAVLVEAPLESGAPDAAPFDAILIDGAAEQVPDELWAQLAEGGTLVTGLLDRGVSRLARGVAAGGSHRLMPFLEAEAVPLPGFARPKEFVF